MLYHSISDSLRSSLPHAAPLRSLVDFARLSLAPSEKAQVTFSIDNQDLRLTNSSGDYMLYKGTHTMIVSRGHGPEFGFDVDVPATQPLPRY